MSLTAKDCAAVAALLPEAVDPEVDPRVLRVVELHAAVCPSCQDELDSLRLSLALLAELPEVEASADFEAKVMARIRQRAIGTWSLASLRERVLEYLAARPFQTAGLACASAIALVAALRLQPPVEESDPTVAFRAAPAPARVAPIPDSNEEESLGSIASLDVRFQQAIARREEMLGAEDSSGSDVDPLPWENGLGGDDFETMVPVTRARDGDPPRRRSF